MDLEIYWLRSRDMPWGDYGQILFNGMSAHLPRVEGRLQLERTAPFVPPIAFPRRGDVIITDAVRKGFDESLLGPLPVRQVDLAKVVKLEWLHWDREKPPGYLPPSGDPEDYLLVPEHDAVLCEQIGPLWEIAPTTIGLGTYKKVQKRPAIFHVSIQIKQPVPPVFRVEGVPVVLVREDAAKLLLALTDDGLCLDPVEVQLSE